MNNRIKEIRMDHKMTTTQFAKKLGIARNTISGYESGKNVVSKRSQLDICKTFGVNLEWLETGEGEKYNTGINVNELDILMGLFNPDEDEFKTKIITSMLKLDDNGWNAIKTLVEHFSK